MKKYTAFLRGINVGGNKLIKMDELKDAFTSLGFKEVRTLIQSGNVIFEGKETEAKTIRKKIEKMLKETFGHDVTVIIRTEDEIKKIISQSSFKKVFSPVKDAAGYITLLAEEYKNKLKLPLISPKKDVCVIEIK